MIPVFINSFNNLTHVQTSVEQFQYFHGVESLHIVDNASTYPPLCEYLSKEIKAKVPVYVHPLKENNQGGRGAWNFQSHFLRKKPEFKYVIVADCDLDMSAVPLDFFLRGVHALCKYNDIAKVGVSLKIDDLPDESPIKDQVISREQDYWKIKRDVDWYSADIDTSPFVTKTGVGFSYGPALRSVFCSARHRPWYLTPQNLTEEDLYYLQSIPSKNKPSLYYSTLMESGFSSGKSSHEQSPSDHWNGPSQ